MANKNTNQTSRQVRPSDDEHSVSTDSARGPSALEICQQLEDACDGLCIRDRAKVTRELRWIRERIRKGQPVDKKLTQLIDFAFASKQKRDAKLATIPAIEFPESLPISEKRDDIAALIKANQVVILAGETGSGKTTQLPKICLALGRGVEGLIGHTQPRRIAASTVANRIAEELNVELGQQVGYQVRFTDHTQESSLIKLMTDGILLAEIQNDPLLLKYDTLIIDEAHERSLNIDFLLGYLKGILPKRPDLKVIVTSATIDLEKFSKHFNDAPIIQVSGRTYPVDVIYRPWQEVFDDLNDAIVETVEDILTSSREGDILVFMSGEREIREASHAIKKAQFPHLEILPLYARLSLAEQSRVFAGHRGRRIVLATNVAETSITVPGIKYVIDPGTARVSRYSLRTKVQRLPIEPISQASANQRKGRCGRVSNGVCYRLYSEEDFLQRPEFTDAEILRTNLAAVILQMLQMRIGDVRQFPFVDVPDNRQITDGFKLLEELHAVDKKGRVTQLGQQLQRLPLDPKLARILVEGAKWQCLDEALIIVSALSLQDPRERPAEKQQAADEKHRRFWDDDSDFISLINLWKYVEEQRQALSQNQFRKLCQREFLNYMRLREWRELHHQIKLSLRSLNLKCNTSSANYESIHRALIAGLITQIGKKNEEQGARDYLGTRNKKFLIFPGSSQSKKRPKWCLAGEFIETSQLFAHQVAKIDPKWVLDAADHLVKQHYFEPHYDVKSGQVKAYVKMSLLGLVLVEKQKVQYSKVDDILANEIFIRAAFVEGLYRGKGAFFKHNQKAIADVHDLEAKARRRDILADDEAIFALYRQRIPVHIVNLAGFEHWRKEVEKQSPEYLFIAQGDLMLHDAEHVSVAQFPNQISVGEIVLPVEYQFEPGKINDGVSVKTPVEFLHTLNRDYLDWLVPGLLREKCIALVKGLPKQIRKHFVPVPEFVDKVLPRMKRDSGKLTDALGAALSHIGRESIPAQAWQLHNLDDFYRMNIQVVDDRGKVIDQSRDLDQLRARYKKQVQKTLAVAGNEIERSGVTQWDFGELPESVELAKGAVKVKGYPALIDQQDAVDLKILDNLSEAKVSTRKGLCKLALLACPQAYKYLIKNLLKGNDILLSVVKMGRREDFARDIAMAAAAEVFFEDVQFVTNEKMFLDRIQSGKGDLVAKAEDIAGVLIEALRHVVEIKKIIKSSKNALLIAHAVKDINGQLEHLFYPGCAYATPLEWLFQWPRYMKAIVLRLEKVAINPQKDKVNSAKIEQFWTKHIQHLGQEGIHSYTLNQEWQIYRWMLEELRVSLFAQTLKTRVPVSEKRVKNQWEQI